MIAQIIFLTLSGFAALACLCAFGVWRTILGIVVATVGISVASVPFIALQEAWGWGEQLYFPLVCLSLTLFNCGFFFTVWAEVSEGYRRNKWRAQEESRRKSNDALERHRRQREAEERVQRRLREQNARRRKVPHSARTLTLPKKPPTLQVKDARVKKLYALYHVSLVRMQEQGSPLWEKAQHYISPCFLQAQDFPAVRRELIRAVHHDTGDERFTHREREQLSQAILPLIRTLKSTAD